MSLWRAQARNKCKYPNTPGKYNWGPRVLIFKQDKNTTHAPNSNVGLWLQSTVFSTDCDDRDTLIYLARSSIQNINEMIIYLSMCFKMSLKLHIQRPFNFITLLYMNEWMNASKPSHRWWDSESISFINILPFYFNQNKDRKFEK